MARTFQPPSFRLPDKLPLEEAVDRLLTSAARRFEQSRVAETLHRIEDSLPVLESTTFPTPLGTIKTPRLQGPSFSTPPGIDSRRREIVKAAVGSDLMEAVEGIPGVGAIVVLVTNPLGHSFDEKIARQMTPQEFNAYQVDSRSSVLKSISALRAFTRV